MDIKTYERFCTHIWVSIPNIATYCQKCYTVLSGQIPDQLLEKKESPTDAYDRAMKGI